LLAIDRSWPSAKVQQLFVPERTASDVTFKTGVSQCFLEQESLIITLDGVIGRHHFFCLFATLSCWRLSSRSCESRKTLLAEVEIVWEISLAASICLRARKAGLFAMA
jgi:hypothetical protein